VVVGVVQIGLNFGLARVHLVEVFDELLGRLGLLLELILVGRGRRLLAVVADAAFVQAYVGQAVLVAVVLGVVGHELLLKLVLLVAARLVEVSHFYF
jgi:hypothetical protein